ncbi:MAG: DUF5606 domain-containing protein [Muribaculum sp.]|nr:DUF5606 domain-containing protein [Muribaculum sp.]
MLKTILSIAGRPGLFKLVNRGKNMLIVESLATGKRTPAYAHDKVISLGDITMYTTNGDQPLGEVLESVKKINDGNPVDIKAIGGDMAIRCYFETILPDFDQDKVYTTDIKKLLTWYNQLLAAGVSEFVEKEEPNQAETTEKED